MTTTTLRTFLQAHEHDRFLWRGEVVTCQRLTDHYSSYLAAAVEVEGDQVWFSSVGQRSHLPAFTVLAPEKKKSRRRSHTGRHTAAADTGEKRG